jgi:glycosyltransferase involved in cell wall biosynthesis
MIAPRKRILTVVFTLGPGGTERCALNFHLGYLENGHDSKIAILHESNNHYSNRYVTGDIIYVLSLVQSRESLKAWKPEIVHIHSHAITEQGYEIVRALAGNAVFLETNVFSKPSPWANQLSYSFQLSDWCKWLYDRRSSTATNSIILPNAVDVTRFTQSCEGRRQIFRNELEIAQNDFVIGRVGQPIRDKWSPHIIQLFERVRAKRSHCKLILVGPPSQIVSLAKKSNYHSDIRIIDFIHDDADLECCYSSLDLFVLIANQGESFGMVITESLLCQTPVIALATPWADNSQGEVIGHEVGGYICTTLQEVEERACQIIDSPNLKTTLGAMGRSRILRTYDKKALANRVVTLSLVSSSAEIRTDSPPSSVSALAGKYGVLSRLILLYTPWRWLLKYTTGYRTPLLFVPDLIAKLVRAAKKLAISSS